MCYLSGVKDTKDAPSHMRVAPADYLLSESIVYDLSIETNTAVHLLTPLHVEVHPFILFNNLEDQIIVNLLYVYAASVTTFAACYS